MCNFHKITKHVKDFFQEERASGMSGGHCARIFFSRATIVAEPAHNVPPAFLASSSNETHYWQIIVFSPLIPRVIIHYI